MSGFAISFRQVIQAGIVLPLLLGGCAPLIAQQPPAATTAPQPSITTEGQRGGQRGARGPEGTHDFLGLGPAPDHAAAQLGAKLFAGNCAFCHGAKANGGDTGPDLVRSTVVLHDEKGELVGPVIHNGRPNRGMPAFASFSTADLYNLAEFLHERVELTANRGTYKLLDTVTGDPKAGQAWFQGAGGCVSCHSVTGDLAHIGSRLSAPDLQQTLLYPAARGVGTDTPPKVGIILPSGEHLHGTLKRLDDFDISIIDDAGNYRSMQRSDDLKVEVEDPLSAHRTLLDKYTDADMHNITAYLATLK